MPGMLSRRDFLKAAGALAAALWAASWMPAATRAQGAGVQAESLTPSFNHVAAQLSSGQPIADISAGWDGTFWAVDTLGVPHVYDPIQNVWNTFGDGVDAAAKVGDDFYLFRGGEVAVFNPTQGLISLQPIAAQWPDLPPSFTSDLDGAFVYGGYLYLCRGGRYVRTDQPGTATALNTWPNWPKDGSFQAGAVRSAGTYIAANETVSFVFAPNTTTADAVLIFDDRSMYIMWDLLWDQVVHPSQYVRSQLDAGFDAYIAQDASGSLPEANWVFQGPIIWTQSNAAAPTAVALSAWVPSWCPTLRHSPRGRVGNLWSVTTAGAVVYHDGTAWNQAPTIAGMTVLGVDVGEDDAPFVIAAGAGGAALYAFDAGTTSWQPPIALGAISPKQIAVGDATRVYVLGEDGAVSRLLNGGMVAVGGDLQASVAHITANHDGTLWHCDGVSANSFRYISEQPFQATLPIPNATAVQKVASSAYGNALLLVNQAGALQLYRYDSPYLFKTSPSYVPAPDGAVLQNPQVTTGGGRCFVNRGPLIAALDSHTGQELWSAPAPNASNFVGMIYDPGHRLLYATVGNNTLLALDAATGAPAWLFAATANSGAQPISDPVLTGALLSFVCNMVVYTFNTSAAFAQARASQPVTPIWSSLLTGGWLNSYEAGAVFIEDNLVVALLTSAAQSWSGMWLLSAQDGANQGQANVQIGGAFIAPLLGRANWYGTMQSTLLTNIGSQWWALYQEYGVFVENPPAGSNGFRQGFAFYDHVLYTIGVTGQLYAVDTSQEFGQGLPPFQPIPLAPSPANARIGAGPIVATIGQSPVILFSVSLDNVNGSVWMVDATTHEVLAQISTDQMLATQLVVDENGIVYAAGIDLVTADFGQVYAIRIDNALPADRYFIVESELMQDFDEPTAGQLAATARYQTHVTVVDALKSPRPFQSIKVWADAAITVLIDGVSHAIDATTPASVQSDAAGSLTIVSNAGDLSTTALKLWAGFMNPHERILIYPDREFHNRLSTTHANPASTSPDPTRINLATATTYDVTNLSNPPRLFAANEQVGASAAASAIQQMTAAVRHQSGATTARRRAVSATGSATATYLAYADLPGAVYAPVSSPANRAVTTLTPIGFSFDATQSAPFTQMTVYDAAAAIDALEGAQMAAPGSFWSKLRELWEKIKQGVVKVGKFIVSVGKDIYIGLKYIEQEVEKVVKQVVHDIEEVAAAIGSIFYQLGKDIVKAAEALSIIFHLGEVVNTYHLLKNNVATLLTTTLPGLIQQQETTINNTLSTLQNDIVSGIQSLITYLDAGQAGTVQAAGVQSPAALPIQNLQGMGATPTTAFTVTPQGGAPHKVAVPAMWGIHKLRNGMTQSGAPAQAEAGALDFLTDFLKRFVDGGDLKTALDNARQQFSLRPHSAKEFLGMALADVLAVVEVVAVAAVGAIQAGMDTVMDNLAAVATAFLSTPLGEIPVISSLLRAVGLGNITLMDILLFVAAIPVTLLYRIAYGAYPSSSMAAGLDASTTLARVAGLFAGIMDIVGGIFGGISDALDALEVDLSNMQKNIKMLAAVAVWGATVAGAILGDVAAPGFHTIFGSIINTLQGLFGLWSPPSEPPSLALVPSIFGTLVASPLLLFAAAGIYEESNPKDVVGLISNVVIVLPLIVNLLKYAEAAELRAVPPIVDVLAGWVGGEMAIADTLTSTLPAPTALPGAPEPVLNTVHRVYMPTVLQGQ